MSRCATRKALAGREFARVERHCRAARSFCHLEFGPSPAILGILGLAGHCKPLSEVKGFILCRNLWTSSEIDRSRGRGLRSKPIGHRFPTRIVVSPISSAIPEITPSAIDRCKVPAESEDAVQMPSAPLADSLFADRSRRSFIAVLCFVDKGFARGAQDIRRIDVGRGRPSGHQAWH